VAEVIGSVPSQEIASLGSRCAIHTHRPSDPSKNSSLVALIGVVGRTSRNPQHGTSYAQFGAARAAVPRSSWFSFRLCAMPMSHDDLRIVPSSRAGVPVNGGGSARAATAVVRRRRPRTLPVACIPSYCLITDWMHVIGEQRSNCGTSWTCRP
jgi:hypothetical protein